MRAQKQNIFFFQISRSVHSHLSTYIHSSPLHRTKMECPFGYSDKYFDMEYEYRYEIPSSHPSPRPHRSSPQTRHHPQGSRQTDPHGKDPHGTRVEKSWHSDEQRVDPLRMVPVWLATKTDVLSPRPEPHILLFRRPLGTDPKTGLVDEEKAESEKKQLLQSLGDEEEEKKSN